MKKTRRIFNRWTLVLLALAALLIHPPATGRAQGTAFTYQGRLNDGANPASGFFDLRFLVWDAATNGNLIAGPLTNSATAVTNGLFAVTLDFGSGVFTGPPRWLELDVRTNGATAFTALFPLQPIRPVPYAIMAGSASNLLGTLPATNLTGTIAVAQLSASVLTNAENTVTLNGNFSGSGSGLTNLYATNLTGTLPDARLSSNVALLNGNQSFTGTNFFSGSNAFTNRGNSFIGNFFGNGLVGWIVVPGTATQAMSDAGYLLTNSLLTTVTLPAAPIIGDIVRISGAGAGGWQVALNAGQSVIGNFSGYTQTYWTLTGAGQNHHYWYAIASSLYGNKLVAASATTSGGILTSPDAGVTWNLTSAPGNVQWRSVASSADGTKLVAVVNAGSVNTSTNSGSSWTVQSSGLPSNPNWSSVASSADGSKLVAVASGGGLYTSTDSGATWTHQISGLPSNPAWSAVASSADGTRLAATVNGGGMYVSSNSGVSWSAPGATSGAWTAIASSADGIRLVAVQNPGGIYTSGNAGSTWTLQSGAPTSAAWTAVAASADGEKLAACVSGGNLYLSSNGGVTWQSQNRSLTSQAWGAVAISGDGSRIVAAVNSIDGGIYTAQAAALTTSTVGVTGFICGGQGTAVELQYVGNGQWMPVGVSGTIWAN